MLNKGSVILSKKEMEDCQINDEYMYRHVAKEIIGGMDLKELKKLMIFTKKIVNSEEIKYTATVNLP
jgi:hypothetical protein